MGDHSAPTIAWARSFVATRVPPAPPPKISPLWVCEHIALAHHIEPKDLRCRNRRLAAVRQLGMYLTRQLTNASYPHIAQTYGLRDHTTVIYACRKIAERIESDRRFAEEVAYWQTLITDSHAAYLASRQQIA